MELLGLISSEGCNEPNAWQVFLFFYIFAPVTQAVLCVCVMLFSITLLMLLLCDQAHTVKISPKINFL